jgi:hypothetical protein
MIKAEEVTVTDLQRSLSEEDFKQVEKEIRRIKGLKEGDVLDPKTKIKDASIAFAMEGAMASTLLNFNAFLITSQDSIVREMVNELRKNIPGSISSFLLSILIRLTAR